MKTIQEQIAVMQHFAAGGQVEFKRIDGDAWMSSLGAAWNWISFDYRIAEIDPYAELKKAEADPTKQIRLLDECGKGKHSEWKDSGYRWHWCFPPEDYEIRDKPKPMKKVKLLAWFTGERLTWMAEEYSPLEKWRRVPIQDKVIEVEDD